MNVYLVKKPAKKGISKWVVEEGIKNQLFTRRKRAKGNWQRTIQSPRVHNTWVLSYMLGLKRWGGGVWPTGSCSSQRGHPGDESSPWSSMLPEAGRRSGGGNKCLCLCSCSFQSSASASPLTKPNRWPEAREPSVTVQRGQIPGSEKGRRTWKVCLGAHEALNIIPLAQKKTDSY